jgi:hypothetical protein
MSVADLFTVDREVLRWHALEGANVYMPAHLSIAEIIERIPREALPMLTKNIADQTERRAAALEQIGKSAASTPRRVELIVRNLELTESVRHLEAEVDFLMGEMEQRTLEYAPSKPAFPPAPSVEEGASSLLDIENARLQWQADALALRAKELGPALFPAAPQ